VTTLSKLHQAFCHARSDWLKVAKASHETWEYYGSLSAHDFLERTIFNMGNIQYQPSLRTLAAARTAANIFLIAKQQGLNQAMIWKLANA
jgi:hypothetical protein